MAHRASAVLGLAGILLALVGCTSTSNSGTPASALGDNAITVGSFNFAESDVLGEVYSQALEAGGYRVNRAFDLGPREFVGPALARGLIELVPEYSGAALLFASLGQSVPTADPQSTNENLARVLEPRHLTALESAPAQDSNTFVVTIETAARYGLRKLSDVKRVDSELSFGGPPECPTREQCLRGLQRTYGMKFKDFVELDTGGPVTRQALKDGSVDIAVMFTTDPSIARDGLVELVDDRHLQPAENVVPVVRSEVLDRFGPRVEALLNDVSARLTTDVLTQLNAEVDGGKPTEAVATAWLESEHLR